MRTLPLIALLAFSTPVQANLVVEFLEGAPKDRFVATNMSDCKIAPFDLVFDLSGSAAGLIFDVTGAGAGVEVYQPMELIHDISKVDVVTTPRDGEQLAALRVDALDAGAKIGFSIDVDDTLGGREITVNGSEISGALVKATFETQSLSGAFDQNGVVAFTDTACL
ncbi:MAG: aggregation factor core [Pseudomonadota bacterium]